MTREDCLDVKNEPWPLRLEGERVSVDRVLGFVTLL